jgi:hypothetical protein
MEITSCKVKSRILLVLTFGHSNLISGAIEVQLMQTQFYWIPDLKTYQRSKLQQKKMSYEGDMIFQR